MFDFSMEDEETVASSEPEIKENKTEEKQPEDMNFDVSKIISIPTADPAPGIHANDEVIIPAGVGRAPKMDYDFTEPVKEAPVFDSYDFDEPDDNSAVPVSQEVNASLELEADAGDIVTEDRKEEVVKEDSWEAIEAEHEERMRELESNNNKKEAKNKKGNVKKVSSKSIEGYEDGSSDEYSIPKKKKSKLVPVLVTIVIIAFLGVAGFLGYTMLQNKPAEVPVEPIQTGGVVLDTSASDSTGTLIDETQAEQPMFTATGYYDITINEGDNVYLINDAENHTDSYDIYLQYEIFEVINDEDVSVISTGLIEPGKQVAWVPSEKLEKGEHKIHMIEQPYTMEDDGEFIPRFSCDQFITITIQ